MNINGIDSLTLDDYEFLLSVLVVDIDSEGVDDEEFEDFDIEDLDPESRRILENAGRL